MLMSIIKKRMFTLYKKAIPEKKVKNQKSEEPKKSLWSESTGIFHALERLVQKELLFAQFNHAVNRSLGIPNQFVGKQDFFAAFTQQCVVYII